MQVLAEASRRRCEFLLMSFQEHTSLLTADAVMVRAKLVASHRAASMLDWMEQIDAYRWVWAACDAVRFDISNVS